MSDRPDMLDTMVSGHIEQPPRVGVEHCPAEPETGHMRPWVEWEIEETGEARLDLSDLHREMVCRALGGEADDDTLVDEVVRGTELSVSVEDDEMSVSLSYKKEECHAAAGLF